MFAGVAIKPALLCKKAQQFEEQPQYNSRRESGITLKMNDSKVQFEEFKNLCARLLRGENLQFLRLIQKRYDSCNEQFLSSPQMQELLKSTSSKLMNDEKHIFIHLRDFLAELKAWAVHSSSSIFNTNGHKRKAPIGSEGIAKRARADDSTTDCSDVEGTAHKTQSLQSGEFSLKEVSQLVGQSLPASNSLLSSPRTCVVNLVDKIHVPNDSLTTNNHRKVTQVILNSKVLNGTASVKSEHKNTFQNCIGLSERSSNNNENGKQLLQNHNSTSLEAARVLNKPKDECISSMDSSDLVADSTVTMESKEETSELSVSDCGRSVLPSNSGDKMCLDDATVLMSAHDMETEEKQENIALTPEGLEESKQAKHVMRLERLLEQLRDKIEQIREAELSLHDLDAEDSSYILEDRLQKKFVKVWKRLCEVTGRMPSTGRPVEKVFKYEGTRYPEVNRKISKFVNRRKIFPDYHDICGIVKKVNARLSLKLNANQVNNISREAFLDVGEALQNRRHKDFISTFRSKQTLEFRSDQDPALFDEDLQRKLNENRRIGMSRLDEVVSKYSNLQFETGEEPKEVPDGSDADRSHKSEDDEEDEEDPREEELRDGETEENKEESEFLVELDLDESYKDCGGNISDGNSKEIGDKTVSSRTMFGNGSTDEDDVPRDIGDNNYELSSQVTDDQKVDNQRKEDHVADDQEIDSQDTYNQATDNQKTDRQETDSQKTNRQETNNQKTQNQETVNEKKRSQKASNQQPAGQSDQSAPGQAGQSEQSAPEQAGQSEQSAPEQAGQSDQSAPGQAGQSDQSAPEQAGKYPGHYISEMYGYFYTHSCNDLIL
ncbi:hypothetical protein C0Q70_18335 [Pomacea canaliculata]|uniref:Daxx histone-binding domain-containing protein n=1 Tax=Pomacea canaliculata TaxID=400727 RepID=A0A2T7NMX3_POMCA|nr:hypothetical protein C0Q70_18335 [Pomacea canaliculata]